MHHRRQRKKCCRQVYPGCNGCKSWTRINDPIQVVASTFISHSAMILCVSPSGFTADRRLTLFCLIFLLYWLFFFPSIFLFFSFLSSSFASSSSLMSSARGSLQWNGMMAPESQLFSEVQLRLTRVLTLASASDAHHVTMISNYQVRLRIAHPTWIMEEEKEEEEEEEEELLFRVHQCWPITKRAMEDAGSIALRCVNTITQMVLKPSLSLSLSLSLTHSLSYRCNVVKRFWDSVKRNGNAVAVATRQSAKPRPCNHCPHQLPWFKQQQKMEKYYK